MDVNDELKSTDQCLVPKLVEIPEGDFLMGCAEGRSDERPVHRVWVSRFFMAVHTVTNREYLRFCRTTQRPLPSSLEQPQFRDPDQPVVAVSWWDATEYCSWLSAATGEVFRLPSEAEWEKAARAGREGALYSWGDEDPASFDVYRVGWADGRPQRVGLLPPNRFGIFNLGDNVHEWCLDWYDGEYYGRAPYRDPVNREPSRRRSSRGGSWRHRVKVSRCAARSAIDPTFQYTDYGFRLVKAGR
ncbi:MAG: SUMF1/EgtB/PvdO family nonheme iron enzyme [Acidobacteriota bacterium]